MNKLLRKISVLFLAVVIILTGFPVDTAMADSSTSPGQQGTKTSLYEGKAGKFAYSSSFKAADGTTYKFTGKDLQWMQIYAYNYQSNNEYIGGARELSGNLKRYRIKTNAGSFVGYCIEHGVMVNEGLQLRASDYKNAIIMNGMDDYVAKNIKLALFYGRQNGDKISNLINDLGFKDSKWYEKNSSSGYTLDDWEVATRMLIFESQQQYRDKNFKLKSGGNGLSYTDSWRGSAIGKINSDHYQNPLKGKPAYDIYKYMEQLCQDHEKFSKKVSGSTLNLAKNISFGADDRDALGNYYKKIEVSEDTAYALKAVNPDNPSKEIEGITMNLLEEGGKYFYELTVTQDAYKEGVTFAWSKVIQGRVPTNDLLVWELETTNGHLQAITTGMADPMQGYFKFSISPDPVEGEPSEPEYFPTFEFPVHKDDYNVGWDGDVCTPMGDATLAATYVLYRDGVEVDRVTLDEDGSTQILSDKPWETPDDLTKTESGQTAVHMIPDGNDPPGEVPHGCGTVIPTKVEWTGNHTYMIKEIRPDGRFLEPDQYSSQRSYEVSYYAITEDERNYACEAPAWTNIKYTVDYNTTAGDGGNHTAGPGTIDSLEEFLSYDQETFINDNYRGKITISKSLEREDPFKDNPMGGQPDSVKSEWKMYLASGGYENHPYLSFVREADLVDGTSVYRVVRDISGTNNATENLLIGTNGDMIIYDIPYGRYWMEEVAADDASFVREKFEVNIDEHGGAYTASDTYDNRYDYNLRDKKKTNIIKVVKTDAETGKQVYEPGTKFYIRYKGNPLNTDDENKDLENYNRYLPNAQSITSDGPYTFEADENGEITIKYELPYGIYEILEWNLPEGYFIGEYNQAGNGLSYSYGEVTENETKAPAGSQYLNIVSIYDAEGNKVAYKDKSEYDIAEISNSYIFKVTEQALHTDGNFGQLVTYDKQISAADSMYDSAKYPYIQYYKAVAMANNQVKGKIEIEKKNEILAGFMEETVLGQKILKPVYETAGKLKDAVFGIFGAEDIQLKDGNNGPEIYDAATDEKIDITKDKSTHYGNISQTITGLLGKLFGSAEQYVEGTFSHNSGAEFWFFRDRESGHAGADGEDNQYTRMYVSPEQKDTTYSYTFETYDEMFTYRYDVLVTMNYQAGGQNKTDIEISKTAVVTNGYTVEIPITKASGSVEDGTGIATLSPLTSYFSGNVVPDSESLGNALSVYEKIYTYEADGGLDKDQEGTEIDLSDIGIKRYAAKDYIFYELTADDVKLEERAVRQEIDTANSVDNNGDGDYDDPGYDADGNGDYTDVGDILPDVKVMKDVTAIKTVFEWENHVTLTDKTEGARAISAAEFDTNGNDIIEPEEISYKVFTTGYYENAQKVKAKSWFTSDAHGNIPAEYVVPEGWREVPFTANPETMPHYIIIIKEEPVDPQDPTLGTNTLYKVLLDDKQTWQDCDSAGNFEKMTVQVYKISYTQQADNTDGFTMSWDGFELFTEADSESKTATTVITKQADSITPMKDVGIGYTYAEEGNSTTFTASEPTSPVYFLSSDGVKTEMYYFGGYMKATLTIPQSAADKDYEKVVPILDFLEIHEQLDENGDVLSSAAEITNLNWYETLTPSNPVATFEPIKGVKVTATRVESNVAGEPEHYVIEIISNQTEEAPLKVTFADGYTMTMYADKAASGNGVGVIVLDSVYKTTRYTLSELVETLTTDENGHAVSSALPLGKYIVKELSVTDGYVLDNTSYEVTLSYKDQFTPLVWGKVSATNKVVPVEIEIKKAFETNYQSGEFVAGDGAVFGIYTGQNFASDKETEGLKSVVFADTLIDVVAFDENGLALKNIKLPEGSYYIKEISTRKGYVLNETPFYFYVSDNTKSESCEFEYASDGIEGKIIFDSYGKARILVTTEVRYPMPVMTVDGVTYPLEISCNANNVLNKADKAFAATEITVLDGETRNVVLPNGKTLSVTVTGNTYKWNLAGTEKEFIPTVSDTSYYTEYELGGFEPVKGESLDIKTDKLTVCFVKEATDTLEIDVIHSPVTKINVIEKEKPGVDLNGDDDYDDEGETAPVPAVTETVGVLDKEGYQIYTHSAVIKRVDDPALSGVDISLKEDEYVEVLLDSDDPVIKAKLDKKGTFKISMYDILSGALGDIEHPVIKLNSADVSSDIYFTKSVTLGRQDNIAAAIQVKINTIDNFNSSAVENEADKKPDVPVIPTTPSGDSANLLVTKLDGTSGNILSGAIIEIWSSKTDLTGAILPDQLIDTVTTDEHGKAYFFLPKTGIYFYKEVEAPEGYILNDSWHQVEIKTLNVLQNVKLYNYSDKISIGTTAYIKETGTSYAESEKYVTIIDEVSYSNVEVGKTYTLKGVLMNKETGKKLKAGGKTITATKTFVATEKYGTVQMSFKVNISKLDKLDIVVFEELYLDDKLVAQHTDLEDINQTVTVKKFVEIIEASESVEEDPSLSVPKTGDTNNIIGLLLLFLGSAIALYVLSISLKRRNN